jgi:hypothetical protein
MNMSNRQYQSETYDSSYAAKSSPKLLPKANSQSGSPKLRPKSWSQKILSKASPQSYFRNLLSKPNPRNYPKANPQNYFQKYYQKKFTKIIQNYFPKFRPSYPPRRKNITYIFRIPLCKILGLWLYTRYILINITYFTQKLKINARILHYILKPNKKTKN